MISVFAIVMLAVFALPVSAMDANMAPDNNIAPGNAPNLDDSAPPMPPSEQHQVAGENRFNNTTPENGASIQPRDQNIRDRARNATNDSRPDALNATNVRERIDQRVTEFDATRDSHQRISNTTDTQSFILQANAFANTLNATQRQQFNQLIFGFLNQSMDNRIDVANRFGVRGADNATVQEYINASEGLKAQIAAANSTQERRKLVNQANREWADFKKDVVKKAARDRILNATDKAQAALGKLNAIIANLSANGTDTAKLENMSALVQNRIDKAREQNITLRQAEWRLAYARNGLAHLANQVKRAINASPVDDLQERAEPANLAVEDAVEPEVPATPTTVANATGSQ